MPTQLQMEAAGAEMGRELEQALSETTQEAMDLAQQAAQANQPEADPSQADNTRAVKEYIGALGKRSRASDGA